MTSRQPTKQSSADPSASGDLRLSRIGQVAVTVEDAERATTFYRDTLGVPHLFAVPGMSFFDCGGVRLMLSVPEGTETGASSILYFRVDDIESAAATLRDRGVTFEGEPHAVHRTDEEELWMAFFRDSEGNVMALMAQH